MGTKTLCPQLGINIFSLCLQLLIMTLQRLKAPYENQKKQNIPVMQLYVHLTQHSENK